jgi:uncharacterized DUF497 family protein
VIGLLFEWSSAKADSNWRKHRVTFREAITVFADPVSRTIPDPDHSFEEERYITIGQARTQRL